MPRVSKRRNEARRRRAARNKAATRIQAAFRGRRARFEQAMVRRVARAEIRRATEDKEWHTGFVNLEPGAGPVITSSAYWQANNCIDITDLTLRQIVNGNNNANRIGNRIRLRSCVLRGMVFVDPDLTEAVKETFGPFEVKMWVVSSRQQPNFIDKNGIRTLAQFSFFDVGNTQTGFAGNLIDHCQRINEPELHLYQTRTFKIGVASGPWNTGGTTMTMNNDYKLNRKFIVRLGKYMNKNIVYNDGVAEPRNKKVFIVWNVVPAVGSTATIASKVRLTFNLHLKYEDN